jgi:hypothetical protein
MLPRGKQKGSPEMTILCRRDCSHLAAKPSVRQSLSPSFSLVALVRAMLAALVMSQLRRNGRSSSPKTTDGDWTNIGSAG